MKERNSSIAILSDLKFINEYYPLILVRITLLIVEKTFEVISLWVTWIITQNLANLINFLFEMG